MPTLRVIPRTTAANGAVAAAVANDNSNGTTNAGAADASSTTGNTSGGTCNNNATTTAPPPPSLTSFVVSGGSLPNYNNANKHSDVGVKGQFDDADDDDGESPATATVTAVAFPTGEMAHAPPAASASSNNNAPNNNTTPTTAGNAVNIGALLHEAAAVWNTVPPPPPPPASLLLQHQQHQQHQQPMGAHVPAVDPYAQQHQPPPPPPNNATFGGMNVPSVPAPPLEMQPPFPPPPPPPPPPGVAMPLHVPPFQPDPDDPQLLLQQLRAERVRLEGRLEEQMAMSRAERARLEDPAVYYGEANPDRLREQWEAASRAMAVGISAQPARAKKARAKAKARASVKAGSGKAYTHDYYQPPTEGYLRSQLKDQPLGEQKNGMIPSLSDLRSKDEMYARAARTRDELTAAEDNKKEVAGVTIPATAIGTTCDSTLALSPKEVADAIETVVGGTAAAPTPPAPPALAIEVTPGDASTVPSETSTSANSTPLPMKVRPSEQSTLPVMVRRWAGKFHNVLYFVCALCVTHVCVFFILTNIYVNNYFTYINVHAL